MDAAEEIKKIIFKYLPPREYQIFLFGSRAIGNHNPKSDYDVGILGKEPIPEQIIPAIEEELENSDIIYKVDVVDFNHVSPRFKELALKNIKLWTKTESKN